MRTDMMISLILPAYNCSAEMAVHLPALIRRMNELNAKYEIIIIDDASSDSSVLKKRAMENGCIYLRNDKNSGKGYSIRKGFEAAGGSVLIFMDGDFPFELDVIDRMIIAFEDGKNEIVIGDRTLSSSYYYPEKHLIRKMGSKILSFLASHYIVPGYPDTQCGIKGFRRTVFKEITPLTFINGFSFDLEWLFIAIRKKYRIRKIPVKTRIQSSSHVRVFYHGFEMLLNIVRIYINYLKGKYRYEQKNN
jgi:dolichyl-phosphate beta-glucosyltransferase